MSRPCPACGRANPEFKGACLYCGRELPDPSMPPPKVSSRELSPEQDARITEALRRGDLRRMREVLAELGPGAPAPSAPPGAPTGAAPAPLPPRAPAAPQPVPAAAAPASRPAPPPNPAGAPPAPPGALPRGPSAPPPSAAPPVARPAPAPVAPPPVAPPPGSVAPAPPPTLESLETHLAEARAALAQDQPPAAAAALRALAQAALALAAALPPEAPPAELHPPAPPVELPPIRQAWLLVVDGPNDADRAAELAEALGLDLPTARVLASSPSPRVALRGDDAEALRRRAERCVVRTGLHASVISREALLALPPPLTVLRAPPVGPWSARPERLWDQDPEDLRALAGQPLERPRPALAVPAEVVSVHQRLSARPGGRLAPSRLHAPVSSTERRVGVLDLYSTAGALRLVEGLTDLDRPQGSVKLGFRAFEENLAAELPGVKVELRRVFRSLDRRAPTAEQPELVLSGWPQHEEHSRTLWLHHQARPNR